MAAFSWPSVLDARSCTPNLLNAAKSGGRSISGIESRVISDAGYWKISISEIPIMSAEEAAAYQMTLARLRSGDEVIAEIANLYAAPGARDTATSATIAGAHPLRATQIAIFVYGITLEPGYYFSLGGERLHLITEVVAAPGEDPISGPWAPDDSSPWAAEQSPWVPGRPEGSWLIAVVPPIRSALADGAVADFKNLRLRCVPQELSDGDLQLDLGRFGSPSLALIESF